MVACPDSYFWYCPSEYAKESIQCATKLMDLCICFYLFTCRQWSNINYKPLNDYVYLPQQVGPSLELIHNNERE